MRLAITFFSTAIVLAMGCGNSSLGSRGDMCTAAADCKDGLQCNTADGTCQPGAGAECSDNLGCANGTICNQSGVCEVNKPGGSCDVDENCASNEVCTDKVCQLESCGGQLFQANPVEPNMVIVLDRSSSMVNNSIGGVTRWDIAKSVVDSVLTAVQGKIRFGFMLFPGQNQDCAGTPECTPGAVFQNPLIDNKDPIITFLGAATTCNARTPISGTLDALVNYTGLEETTRPNYVLLITDGEQTCTGDPAASAMTLRTQTPEIKTFAVGFDIGSSTAAQDQLDAIATAGGTARAGTPKYYPAGSAAELEAVLASITGSVLACDYALTDTPPNASELGVYTGTTALPRSDTDGWQYDEASNRIVFSGNTCTQLQSGAITDLKIIFGCPDDIIIVR